MSSKIKIIIFIIASILILIIPLPAGDEYLRVHVKEGSTDGWGLYYATAENPEPGDDTFIKASYDPDTENVEFRIPGDLEKKITVIRIDLPAGSELIMTDGVSVSSAGIIRSRYAASDLFNDNNLAFINDASVQTVPSKEAAYISAGGNDPFVVFNEDVTKDLTGHFSHKLLTRICIVLLACAGIYFYRKE